MPAPTTPMPGILFTDAGELALSPFGVALEEQVFATVPLETTSGPARDIRGVGLYVANDGRIRSAVSTHCYTGAKLGASDSRITDSDLWNHRDTCLWIARDAGNCNSLGNHFYGSRIAIYNQGEGYQSTSDKVEDSFLGALCDAKSKFVGTKSKQNLIRDFVLRGGFCELIGCTIELQAETKEHNVFGVPGLPWFTGKAGIEIVGGGARIRDCSMFLTDWTNLPHNTPSGKAATGIIVAADDCKIDCDVYDLDKLDGSTAIRLDGQRHDIAIKGDYSGFHGPNERILVHQQLKPTDKCTSLDVMLKFEVRKKLKEYIDLVPGWTGRVRVWNKVNGDLTTLPTGKAA